METKKLFNVLVMGGSMLTAGLAIANDPGEENAFCDPTDQTVCTVNDEGLLVPRDGVVCCWGTSCEEPSN